MPGLKEWYEEHSGTYDPEQVIVELGNPIPEMVIQDIKLKDCHWYVNPEAEDEEARKAVSEEVSFQYEEVKMVGKKHRVRTYSTEEMNNALKTDAILPVHLGEQELAQVDSDAKVEL